jgi:hypothetical protein
MSDKIAEIKKKLQEVVGANPNYPIVGTVTAVDGETCSVKLVSGLVLSGVKLSASITDAEDYLLFEPAISSDVLMLSGDGTLSNLYLIKVDQVGKFKFSQGGMKVEFDSTDKKVKIENDTVNLKDLFTDLATILNSLKVSVVAVGAPSGNITPDVVTLVTNFSTKVDALLK